MMPDIFSSFDPFMYISSTPSSLFLYVNVFLVVVIQATFWLSYSRSTTLLFQVVGLIFMQLSRTQMMSLKGISSIVVSVFLSIVLINLFGLVPYMFSTSSHLVFTLILGLPLWLSMILSSFTKSPKASIAHFLPDGAPDWLNPFLVLIETTSIMVRPMTLSFRLAANMSAGHIVLSLVGIYCASACFMSVFNTTLLIFVSIGYIVFEVAICLIQAYIFCLLLSLYSDDHAH